MLSFQKSITAFNFIIYLLLQSAALSTRLCFEWNSSCSFYTTYKHSKSKRALFLIYNWKESNQGYRNIIVSTLFLNSKLADTGYKSELPRSLSFFSILGLCFGIIGGYWLLLFQHVLLQNTWVLSILSVFIGRVHRL